MIDKFAGYKTQIRVLEKKLKEMDHSKLNPTKVKELTEAIQNLKDIVKEKEDKKIERRKKKEEAVAAKPAEAATQPEVVKESAPEPTEEVVKEADVVKFAMDSKVEPIRGTPGSWGVIIREAGVNGDPLCYVKWMEGTLKTAHGDYGAYYPSDLRLKVEATRPMDYVPREQVYNLEADYKGKLEKMIKDLEEEHKTALDKGEAVWAHRIEQKINDAKKALSESSEKKAEDENGSGGTNKLKVVDQNPAYDKDPQEKATGYGGDRTYGWQTAPSRDDMTSLSSLKEAELKPMNVNVGSNFYNVNPLPKPSVEEFEYDVLDSLGTKLFKITAKQELDQEHLSKIIETELTNKKEATIQKHYALYVNDTLATRTITKHMAEKIAQEKFPEAVASGEYKIVPEEYPEKPSATKMATLIAPLAFLKKGALISILGVDNNKKQVKFASLDGSLKGWAPSSKFAAFDVPDAKLIDHNGHKDEILSENGTEILVTCPANSVNVEWRTVEAPPATPESLNPDVTAAPENKNLEYIKKEVAGPSEEEKRKKEEEDYADSVMYHPASLSKEAHIRHEGDKWIVYNHDYTKKLGTYDTEAEAQKRLRQIEYFKHQGSLKPLSKKEADSVMETKCEDCGKELGPEVFLSEYPVCGKCIEKRRAKALGKRADQDISLADQVQGFRDRMQAVNDRLANPPAKTADLETKEDVKDVNVKELVGDVAKRIDTLETKLHEEITPETHKLLEEFENNLWQVELSLGITPAIPEHEKAEPEHKEIVKEVDEEPVEKEAMVPVLPSDASSLPPDVEYVLSPDGTKWVKKMKGRGETPGNSNTLDGISGGGVL